MGKKVNFIGIGVQKSASTWVYKILEDHPDIECSNPKELDFFSFFFDKGADWYHSHFNNKKNRLLGEISPSYFIDKDSPLRVKKYNPNMKIIVTLRDPIERAYSNHLHMIRTGCYLFDDISFEKGLMMDETYLEQSRYAKHLKNWFSLFSKENILILFQEEIQKKPEESAKKLYKFLKVDAEHCSAFLKRKANVSYAVKHKKIKKLVTSTFSVVKKIGGGFLVERLRKTNFFLNVRDKNRVPLSTVVPEIKSSTREFLIGELTSDMKELVELLNVKTLPWNTWRYLESKDSFKK